MNNAKSTYNKGTIESLFLFILSPIFSLPAILYNIIKGNEFGNRLLIIFCSLISFLYIPSFSNDKMRYLERYAFFKKIDFSHYLDYLIITKRPDFILETVIYFFAQFNIRIEFLFFLTTFITMSLLYEVVHRIKRINNLLLITVIFFLSISFQNLFSGIRFYLGVSILLYAVYNLYEKKSKVRFVLFSIIAVFTHFSMSLLIFTAFFAYYYQIRNLKVVFFVSLGFFFVPKSLLSESLSFLDISEAYNNKASGYLGEVDSFGDSLENFASFVAFQGKLLWYYFLCFYFLYRKHNINNLWWRFFIITAIIVNITYSIPVVFFRYSLVLKLIFLFYLVTDLSFFRNKKIVYLYIILCFIGSLIEVNQVRFNLIQSLLKSENIFIYGILQQETDEKTFIDI